MVDPNARINTETKGSLTVKHVDADGNLAPGVASKIYLVATVDELGVYTITEGFRGFFSDLNYFNNGFDCDKWKECVAHTDEGNSNTGDLETYIKNNSSKILPVASGTSNERGETLYENLDLGIYFVESGTYEKKSGNEVWIHTFINFLYPVPLLDKHEGEPLIINYHPTASPKKARDKKGVETHCSIQKQWNDGGYANRPASVVFEIYCDGELMETVTLSSSNNWYYEWQNLGAHEYTVREIGIADGYSSSISVYQKPGTHDFVYTCVNSRGGGDNPPPPPDNPPPDNPPPDNPPPDNPPPNTPPSNPPGVPDIPAVLGAIRQLPQVLGARRLPQTGQLWWPLPILVIAGIFFIVKGIKKNAKMKAQNN
jgi:hypothetical protein